MAALTEQDVADVVGRFAAAYGAKDVDALMALIAADPDVVIVGTGADEVCLGPDAIRAQFERDVAQADTIALEMGPLRTTVHGDVAWAFTEPTITAALDGAHLSMALRMTLVVARDGDRAVIRSGHLSAPYGEQGPGRSFPADLRAGIVS